MAHLQQVIIAEVTVGRGTDKDPSRIVKQFWSTDGDLLGQVDPIAPRYRERDAVWVVPSCLKIQFVEED